eukprot:11925153-Heterocapsa_arctica.AAC.1
MTRFGSGPHVMSADSSGSVWVRGRSLFPTAGIWARAASPRGRPLGRSRPRATLGRRGPWFGRNGVRTA